MEADSSEGPFRTIEMQFHANLKALRDANKLTNQEIADRIQKHIGGTIDVITVQRWFAAKSPKIPNLPHLVGLCKVFGVTPNDLLGDRDDRERTAPSSIEYMGSPLIRLVRRPRPGEESGVDIVRRLCQQQSREKIAEDLKIDEGELEGQVRRAANGDLFKVVEPIATDDSTAQRLKQRYELQVCEVAPIDGIDYGLLQTIVLSALGARLVKAKQLEAPQSVGLAGGFTCARLVISLAQTMAQSDGLRLMPIAVQGSTGEYTALNANTLVGMFGYLMGRSSPDDVTIVQYLSNAELANNPEHATRKLLDQIVRQVSIAFLGLGGSVRWFFNGIFRSPRPVLQGDGPGVTGVELAEAGCIGDILYNFVNSQGVMPALKPVCDQLVCSIGLKGLRDLTARNRPVVAIVADEYKAPVVSLALREGYINGLITTRAVATKLLALTPPARKG